MSKQFQKKLTDRAKLNDANSGIDARAAAATCARALAGERQTVTSSELSSPSPAVSTAPLYAIAGSSPDMTPTEFKRSRLKLGLSAAQLGNILNIDPRTIGQWEDESGTRLPNPIACRVLQWLLDDFRPPERPQAIGRPKETRDAWRRRQGIHH